MSKHIIHAQKEMNEDWHEFLMSVPFLRSRGLHVGRKDSRITYGKIILTPPIAELLLSLKKPNKMSKYQFKCKSLVTEMHKTSDLGFLDRSPISDD